MRLKTRINRLESQAGRKVSETQKDIDLPGFMGQVTGGNWQPADHLNYLANDLEEVESGEISRLMVFLPPRFGKSELISRGFPTFYLGKNPEKRVILTSYGAELAYNFSRISRNRLRDHSKIFGYHLAADSKSVKNWDISGHQGGLTAAGVGGPITGKGGDLIIIDDPIKNYEEAHSQKLREKLWNWYQTTLLTRLEPGGAIILVQTRWHRDDLAGRLLDQEPQKWEVLRLPVFAEEEDPLDREPGELLWPTRFSRREIEEKRETQGRRKFSALYQQKPPEETAGALWNSDMIKHVEEEPELDRVIIGVDPAVSNKPGSDETGIVLAGKRDSEGYILADESGQYSSRQWAQKVNQLFSQYEANLVVAEKNQGGDLVKSNLKTVNPTLPVETVHAKKRKTLRAEPIASLYESGKVFHVGEFEKLEKQLTTWTQGDTSPDRLDACVYVLTELLLGQQKDVIKKKWIKTYNSIPKAGSRDKFAYLDLSEGVRFYVNIIINSKIALYEYGNKEYSLENIEKTLKYLSEVKNMEVIAVEQDVYDELPEKFQFQRGPVRAMDLSALRTKKIIRMFKNGKIFLPQVFQWSNQEGLFKAIEVTRISAQNQTTY